MLLASGGQNGAKFSVAYRKQEGCFAVSGERPALPRLPICGRGPWHKSKAGMEKNERLNGPAPYMEALPTSLLHEEIKCDSTPSC